MTYEQLILEAEEQGITVNEKCFFSDAKGLCRGNRIGINKAIETSAEKACVLAEELGHHYTTVGNILDLQAIGNQKQERRARAWAYEKLVPVEEIRFAILDGHTELYDMAEYLDIDEFFLHDALQYYNEKYGPYFLSGTMGRLKILVLLGPTVE